MSTNLSHRLSPAALQALEDLCRHNVDGLAWMQQRIQRADTVSARLSPRDRADYRALRAFFRRLSYHEGNSRTYSWISQDEQTYFFPPVILSHPWRVHLEMRVRYQRSRFGIADALLETGLHQGWHTDAGASFQIRGAAELVRALHVIHRFHDGYILPGGEQWLAQAQKLAGREGQDLALALASLQQPDCWI